jgi:peptidoglycan/LPS O-acetylase OafA/YrhL
MFGAYRLILASIVALSHVGLTLRGFNPGQWSVVCFYVLSGFLMERQFHKLAPAGGIRAFYLDRLLRIFPVYFTVTLLCSFFFATNWIDTVLNFSLLPLNFAQEMHVPIYVGPAWSLACEAQFYLLVPWLALTSTRVLRLLLALSLTFFAVSVFSSDTGLWAYRLPPGIFFTFLSGMLINRREWPTLYLAYGFIAFLWLIFASLKLLSINLLTGIHINVCLGYFVAIPATATLSRLSPKVAWDQFLGLFSYPLFLIHMLVLDLCQAHLTGPVMGKFIALSLLAAAALVVVVEKPFDLIRYRVRKSKSIISSAQKAPSPNGPSRI